MSLLEGSGKNSRFFELAEFVADQYDFARGEWFPEVLPPVVDRGVQLRSAVKVPRALKVSSELEMADVVEVLGRPALFELNGRLVRCSPSGVTEDVTEQFARVSAIFSRQEVRNAPAKNEQGRK